MLWFAFSFQDPDHRFTPFMDKKKSEMMKMWHRNYKKEHITLRKTSIAS